jgi:hypothetical protein
LRFHGFQTKKIGHLPEIYANVKIYLIIHHFKEN